MALRGICGTASSHLSLSNNENAYSKACEIRGEVEGSINQIVSHDFAIMKELFDFDFEEFGTYFEIDCMSAVTDYQGMSGSGKVFNSRIKARINQLKDRLEAAGSVEEFKKDVTEFYKDFGVGKLGLHKAFRIQHRAEDVEIVPITNIAHVKLDDLVGYELAKQKLIDNTEAFVRGKEANKLSSLRRCRNRKVHQYKGTPISIMTGDCSPDRGVQTPVSVT